MATTPEDAEVQTTVFERVVTRISAPVSSDTGRHRILFVALAALGVTAPTPLNAILVGVVVLLAYDRKR
jgi:hypothetical protein